MASSISGKTLTVTINESLTLGDDNNSNRTQFEISNIAEVSQRVMTVPTYKTAVLMLSSSAGAGTYHSGSLKYARITNLDNENFIQLTFMSASGGSTKNKCEFKLDPLRSFVFTNDAYSGSDKGDSFSQFAGFKQVKAKADTAACDIEIYVAST